MWKFTYPQRIKQQEALARLSLILFVTSLPVFIICLGLLISNLFESSYLGSIISLSQFLTYLAAGLGAIAGLLSWHRSTLWDFIFNQLSILLVVAGFGLGWWHTIHDTNSFQEILVILLGFGLAGLGHRFRTPSTQERTGKSLSNEPDTNKASTTQQLKALSILDLQHPQTIKSITGAIVWGFWGVIVAMVFLQPIIIPIALLLGILIGVDRKQTTLWQNLRLVFFKAIKFAAISMCVSAIIGVGFASLLFGFNQSALLAGIGFGGLIGLFIGAFLGTI
ncbi:MAG: hypothetical protein H6668_05800 [Ardenticatenaceae bacterium]|nr:hypothetical protein [Ardenticatenaceae bacterium]